MKGSGGSFSAVLLNEPLSPESLVFPGAALDEMLVIKPFATGEEVPPLSWFSRLRLLCMLGLGGDPEKTRSEVRRWMDGWMDGW